MTGRNHQAVRFGMVSEFSGPFPGYSAMLPKDRQPFVKTLQEMAIRQPVLASGTRHLTTCRALAGVRPLAGRARLRLLPGLPWRRA